MALTNTRGVVIYNIQALRAFAAICVAISHATSNEGVKAGFSFGASGVDVFFVISGFVISYITAFDSSQFVLKRLIRIVPLYWAGTLGLFVLAWFEPRLLHHTTADPVMLAKSLFFIPYRQPLGPFPLLILGWTLNYEMYFYAMFAVGLRISAKHARPICAALILLVFAATKFVAPASTFSAFYGRDVVLEFLFGMMACQLLQSLPSTFAPAPRRGPGFALALLGLAAGLAGLLLDARFAGRVSRLWAEGIPALVIVCSALILEFRYRTAERGRLLLLLGEASYVLYLVHPYVIYGILRVAAPSATHWPEWAKWPLVALAIAATCAVAVALHLYFEKPVMAALRRRLIHRPPPIIFDTDPAARPTVSAPH